jgi:hypothetical protein
MPRKSKTDKGGAAVAEPKVDPKAKREVPAVKKSDDPSVERQAARELGISLVQLRVLSCLDDTPRDYGHVRDKTGYYNGLSRVMRAEYPDSLGSMKLVKESVTTEGRPKVLFALTALGKKTLERAKKLKAAAVS